MSRTASSEPRRRRNSSADAGGNFGAYPKPPAARVELPKQKLLRLGEESLVERLARRLPLRRAAQRADERLGLRRHVLAAARGTRRRPRAKHLPERRQAVRGSGGKYVPPKNGSPSGVRNTVSGQPPCPVRETTASM